MTCTSCVGCWRARLNLLLIPGHYDIALRDFGLFVAAIALSRLAVVDETTDRHLIH